MPTKRAKRESEPNERTPPVDTGPEGEQHDEFARVDWQVKDLARREQVTVAEAEVVETVRRVLAGS